MAINDFYAGRMAKLGVPFIDTRPVASDAQGNPATYLNDPKSGKRTLIRAADGVHMSMTGYIWITRGLAGPHPQLCRCRAQCRRHARPPGVGKPRSEARPADAGRAFGARRRIDLRRGAVQSRSDGALFRQA